MTKAGSDCRELTVAASPAAAEAMSVDAAEAAVLSELDDKRAEMEKYVSLYF